MLRNRSLTLLDPSTWDDSNDSFYISEYKRRKVLNTTLAICLSGADETYHHWKIFAGHASGVCIRLRQGMLLKALKGVPGMTVGMMDYRKVKGARSTALPLEEYPFVKRAAFIDEKEVRILYESATKFCTSLDVPIPLECIGRITLSPWLPKGLIGTTRGTLPIYSATLTKKRGTAEKAAPRFATLSLSLKFRQYILGNKKPRDRHRLKVGRGFLRGLHTNNSYCG